MCFVIATEGQSVIGLCVTRSYRSLSTKKSVLVVVYQKYRAYLVGYRFRDVALILRIVSN